MMTAPVNLSLTNFSPPSREDLINHIKSLAPSKLVGGDDDEKKKKKQTYQTQAEIDAANAFARDFSKRHNTMFANESHVADKVGDPVVQFRTLDGKPYAPAQMPASMIQNFVPDDVKELYWDNGWQMPYYKNGDDMIFVDKKFYNSPRFLKFPTTNAVAVTK